MSEHNGHGPIRCTCTWQLGLGPSLGCPVHCKRGGEDFEQTHVLLDSLDVPRRVPSADGPLTLYERVWLLARSNSHQREGT